MVWRRERRARRRRLALVVVSLVACGVVAVGTWVALSVDVVRLRRARPGPCWRSASGAACAVSLVWPRSDPGRWARGAAGELATAALLERLPRRRWVVLHDLAVPG